MLSEQYARQLEECNEKIESCRFDELIQLYEDSVQAMVHPMLEEYVDSAFRQFMGIRTVALL